jgi:arginyl-tRNA synthetase
MRDLATGFRQPSDHFMIKEKLRTVVEDALAEAVKANRLSALLDEKVTAVIEKPKLAEHGDFACGVALKLASKLKSAPFKIAETIAEYIRKDEAAKGFIAKVDVVQPGYINFQLDNQCLVAVLKEIHLAKNSFGKGAPIANEKILLEYVSANPTGELHIGHGRNAVFGSSLANLLRFFGYDVTEEFLVNDAGEQMLHLGRCAWALYQIRNIC